MLYEKIKEITKDRNISIYRIERDLSFSNGSIRKWNTSKPSAISLKKVADYLSISLEELLEESEWTISEIWQ